MTIKQAIFYNVLSSILAFIGMVVGLLLGTINNFSPWMFTATAGTFLYVALVDMIPELSSGHSHPISSGKQQEGNWVDIVLQMLGMFLPDIFFKNENPIRLLQSALLLSDQ